MRRPTGKALIGVALYKRITEGKYLNTFRFDQLNNLVNKIDKHL